MSSLDTKIGVVEFDFDDNVLKEMIDTEATRNIATAIIAPHTDYDIFLAQIIAEYTYFAASMYVDKWRCQKTLEEFVNLTTPRKVFSSRRGARMSTCVYTNAADAFASTVMFANESTEKLHWKLLESDDEQYQFVFRVSEKGNDAVFARWSITRYAELKVEQKKTDVLAYPSFIHYSQHSRKGRVGGLGGTHSFTEHYSTADVKVNDEFYALSNMAESGMSPQTKGMEPPNKKRKTQWEWQWSNECTPPYSDECTTQNSWSPIDLVSSCHYDLKLILFAVTLYPLCILFVFLLIRNKENIIVALGQSSFLHNFSPQTVYQLCFTQSILSFCNESALSAEHSAVHHEDQRYCATSRSFIHKYCGCNGTSTNSKRFRREQIKKESNNSSDSARDYNVNAPIKHTSKQ